MSKAIDKRIFLQGGRCFFCGKTLTASQASIVQLCTRSKGEKANDDNSVACCNTLTQFLKDLTLKEKIQVIMRHGGQIPCPTSENFDKKKIKLKKSEKSEKATTSDHTSPPTTAPASKEKSLGNTHLREPIETFIDTLQQFPKSRPKKFKTLVQRIANHYHLSYEQAEVSVKALISNGIITISGNNIKY
jgi:hypothetical protein